MDGTLLVFFLPPRSPLGAHRTFRRAIYGEETSSWSGRYRYRRRGLLDDLPHVLLYTGVVLVREEDGERLRRTIQRSGGTVIRRTVRLTSADARALALRPR